LRADSLTEDKILGFLNKTPLYFFSILSEKTGSRSKLGEKRMRFHNAGSIPVPDSEVFGPPGSGSESESVNICTDPDFQAKTFRKTLI
jgi:hypothetical protein